MKCDLKPGKTLEFFWGIYDFLKVYKGLFPSFPKGLIRIF